MIPRRRISLSLALLLSVAACSGGGGSGVMMPSSNGPQSGSGNATFRIFVPASQNAMGLQSARSPVNITTPGNPAPYGNPTPYGPVGLPISPGAGAATPGPPGSQMLAISVNGPATIQQTIAVGPNASGCAPAVGGTTCQLTLSLPAGTYAGTVGTPAGGPSTAIAFAVVANGQNVFSLTTGGVPAQVTVVAASGLGMPGAQGGIDFFGAGRHPVVVEAIDANQNVIVGGTSPAFSLNVSGGSLPVTVSQSPGASPNAFSVAIGPTASVAPAFLHATVNYVGANNPCAQPAAVCAGNIRIDDRQLVGIANVGANDVTLYVAGASAPLTTIELGVTAPQALTFDAPGDLFVADQPASVTEYAPPYVSTPTTIGNGVNHPQALAVDAHGNLFVANGSASNTVTVYSPPYNGPPETTIAAGIDDPVSLALDSNANLYVVNQANNTVAIYAPPYSGPPTILSKGLSAPNSLALDAHGNLFVANLNSTPNSVVEFSPPFGTQSAPVVTITDGVNEQGAIGVGGSTNLFVPNEGANTVTEYVAPYTKAPVTISGGESQPVALAIDAAGNLYVANLGNNTVTQYAAPYGSGTWSAISTGISQPIAIALSPASGAGPALVP